MIVFGTKFLSDSTRRPLKYMGYPYYKSEWTDLKSDKEHPHVYNIEMSPGMVFARHFHRSPEFQIVIGGSGSISGEEVSIGSIHFASAYCVYGPLIAGPEGLSYLTMRLEFDDSVLYSGDHDSNAVQGIVHAQKYTLSKTTEVALDVKNEARLFVVKIGKGETHNLGEGTEKSSRLVVVLNGSVSFGSRALNKWEHMFVGADNNVELKSQGGDAQIGILQFPNRLKKIQ